ncbi:MAG: GNAT family N-acetyltransferase, partial [Promethearchaeota archaeon]
PLEEVFNNIGRRTRKHIRRELRRRKVIIEEITEKGKLHECYDLIRKSYKAARVPLADISLLEAAYDILFKKGMIWFTLAKVENVPVAVSVDLVYKNIIYGWYGGMDRSYGCYYPNELLTWYLFRKGVQKGYHVYDFGGAGRPDENYGVRSFKAKFGGELVCFGRNVYIHSPILLNFVKFFFAIYRNFLKLPPLK